MFIRRIGSDEICTHFHRLRPFSEKLSGCFHRLATSSRRFQYEIETGRNPLASTELRLPTSCGSSTNISSWLVITLFAPYLLLFALLDRIVPCPSLQSSLELALDPAGHRLPTLPARALCGRPLNEKTTVLANAVGELSLALGSDTFVYSAQSFTFHSSPRSALA